MDGVSLVVGVVPIVIQLFAAVSKGYDTFIEYKDFPSSYRELHLALKIEKQRLEQWGQKMLNDHRQREIELSQQDLVLWKLFEDIFKKMALDWEGAIRTMEDYGHLVGQLKKSDLFGRLPSPKRQYTDEGLMLAKMTTREILRQAMLKLLRNLP